MAPLITGRFQGWVLRLKRGRVCRATLIMTPKATSMQVKRAVRKNRNSMALLPLFLNLMFTFIRVFSLSPIRRIAPTKINSLYTSFYTCLYTSFKGHIQSAHLKQNRLQGTLSACLCEGAAFPLLLINVLWKSFPNF
jgi:hypothetical protein